MAHPTAGKAPRPEFRTAATANRHGFGPGRASTAIFLDLTPQFF
jgi:hypothetical protein